MKRRLLPVVAVICLVLTGFVSTGYVSEWGIAGIRACSPVPSQVALSRGRFVVNAIIDSQLPDAPPSFHVNLPHLRSPELRPSLWEFDAHTLPTFGARVIVVAFPLWCLLLPLMVAPLAWWRRLQREACKAPQGFPVAALISGNSFPV